MGLRALAKYKPLAKGEEPYRWVNETRIAPWVSYVLGARPGELTELRRRGTAFQPLRMRVCSLDFVQAYNIAFF